MYSSRLYRLLSYGSILVAYSGATCIFFDYKLKLFYITKHSRLRFYFVIFCIPFIWAFFSIRTLQVYLKGNDFLREFAICYAIFLLLSLLFGCIVAITAETPDELRIMASQMFAFFSDFQRKWMPNFDSKTYPTGLKLELLIILIILVINGSSPTFGIGMFILFKDLPLLPHTILPRAWQSSWFILLPEYFGLFIGINVLACFASCNFILIAMYYVTLVPLLKREFKLNLPRSQYRTRCSLRLMDNLLREYTSIECLHRRAMRIYGYSILYMQSLTGKVVLYCNYTLIRHRDHLGPFLTLFLGLIAFNIFLAWTFTLEAAGRFHQDASKVFKSWKSVKVSSQFKKKLLHKKIRSMRPLFVSGRDYFKIKRLTVLKFIMANVKGTFRALLTLK